MASVRILGRDVPVRFLQGRNGQDLDAPALMAGLEQAADLINRTTWSQDEDRAFRAMKEIVFFEGEIEVNGWKLQRPGCDEDDAVFYWEANEFMAYPDADVRANTFFHDCWHVIQFQEAGDFARTDDERVEREVDATLRQIAVAEKLECSEHEIKHLRDFVADKPRIVARLGESVERILHNTATRETGQA